MLVNKESKPACRTVVGVTEADQSDMQLAFEETLTKLIRAKKPIGDNPARAGHEQKY